MMSDELGIPSSLSARASLDVAIAMGSHVAKHRANHLHHLDVMDESNTTQPHHHTHKTTLSTSVDRNNNILSCSELVYDVSQTIEALQHHTGIPPSHDNHNISTYEKDTKQQSFVEALSDADGRLKSCLHEASVVRTALHSLRIEEKLTEMVIRDYDDRPAQHL